MKTLLLICGMFWILNYPLYSITQNINWEFEIKDSSFGQTAAGDIDGDGFLELVFGCYRNDGHVYALNAEDGTLLWKFNTSENGNDGCNDTAPIIFDVDGDQKPEVIVPSSCTAKTYCFNGEDGTIKWVANTRGSDSPPTIGDIDGDGNLELLHGEFGGYVICLDLKNGNRKWEITVDKNSWIQTLQLLWTSILTVIWILWLLPGMLLQAIQIGYMHLEERTKNHFGHTI